jgi:competence protein ComEC
VDVDVLHPSPDAVVTPDANENSLILRVSYGEFDVLLTGDAYRDAERLVTDGAAFDLEVLKAGHHGSDTSTDSLLLARTKPEVALVSAGRRNRYGHPSPSVLSLFTRLGVDVWRTDQRGTVSVVGRADGRYTVTAP